MLRHVRLFSAFIASGVLLVPFALPSAQADETPMAPSGTLANTLTHEEFVRAGLQKLTPEELAALEAALIRHQQLATQPMAASIPADNSTVIYTAPASPAPGKAPTSAEKTAAFGAEQVTKAKPLDTDAELHSHIEGTLEGFSGRAVFVLGNGQIWQQRVPETVYFAKKLVNPEVILTRSFAGYKMLIVPADRVVFVKRVQ
jgi:hypothetical protein